MNKETNFQQRKTHNIKVCTAHLQKIKVGKMFGSLKTYIPNINPIDEIIFSDGKDSISHPIISLEERHYDGLRRQTQITLTGDITLIMYHEI